MHELGIATEILALVRRYVPDRDADRVREVRVRIGELAGVVPSSLEFCFSAAISGTPWQQARMVVEAVPAQAQCQACNHVAFTATPGRGCAACGDSRVRMIAGRELHVVSVDLADADQSLSAGAADGDCDDDGEAVA